MASSLFSSISTSSSSSSDSAMISSLSTSSSSSTDYTMSSSLSTSSSSSSDLSSSYSDDYSSSDDTSDLSPDTLARLQDIEREKREFVVSSSLPHLQPHIIYHPRGKRKYVKKATSNLAVPPPSSPTVRVSYKRALKIFDQSINAVWSAKARHENPQCSMRCKDILFEQGLITLETIKTVRIKYQSKSEKDKNAWILNYMHTHCDQYNKIIFYILGLEVCRTAFMDYHGISDWKIRNNKRVFLSGGTRPKPHAGKGTIRTTDKTLTCFLWTKNWLEKFGNRYDGKIRLPTGKSFKSLYSEMLVDSQIPADMIPNYQTWLAHLQKNLTLQKVPATNFSRCKICLNFDISRITLTSDEDVARWREEKIKHLAPIKLDRALLEERSDTAISHPDDYAYILIDCTPLSSCYTQNSPTDWEGIREEKKLCVVGAICKSIGLQSIYCFPKGSWSKNYNVILTVLHKVLDLLLSKHHPHTLYVQTDNCYGENKNRWFMAYCTWLVSMGTFKKAQHSFLTVGHTYEEIDEMFHCFKAHLRSKQFVFSVQAILDLFETTYQESHPEYDVRAHWLENVWNFGDWFDPHLIPFKGHRSPHSFVYSANNDTALATVRTLKHSYIPTDKLSLPHLILHSLPSGCPDIIIPNSDPPSFQITGPSLLTPCGTTILKPGRRQRSGSPTGSTPPPSCGGSPSPPSPQRIGLGFASLVR